MSGTLSVNEPLNLQNTFFPKNHMNSYKLALMEALEHLHIMRKYKELNLCENCNKIVTNTCLKCSTIHGIKQFKNADGTKNQVLSLMESGSLNSKCSSSNSSKNCSKENSSKIFVEEDVENINIKNLRFNNNKKSPFKSLTQHINKNSQNSCKQNVENSFSKEGNKFTISQNRKKNLKGINNSKKNNNMRYGEEKFTKSIKIKESTKISNCKEKIQVAESYDQLTNKTEQEEKLLIKNFETRSSGSTTVEIIKNSEFINSENEQTKSFDINYAIKKKAVEKSALITSETEIQEKYVVDSIQKGSEGIILLTPGKGKIRFASVIPDNDIDAKSWSEKIINLTSSHLTPIEANEGDYVLVSNIEKNNQRGKVLCKLGNIYYVLLIDSGAIISADKVYFLSDSMKMHKGLGVVITMQEIFSEELIREVDVCYYSVIEKKEKGKLICRLKSTDKDDLLANVIFEKPSHKGNTRSLKSRCSVEISSPGIANTLYVRELDESSGWKLMELNKKINMFCETVPNLNSVPRIGDLCSAKFENDQKFYRGLVKSINNNKIEILFVDFGNSQFFDICSDSLSHIKDLKPLPSGLQAVPFFAVQVSLANSAQKPYSLKAKKYLQKLILESIELVLTYQNFNQGVYLTEKLTGIVVNDILNDNQSEIVETSFLLNNDKFMGDRMKYTIFSAGTKCDMILLYVNEKEFKENKTFWCADALSENFKYINSELNLKISTYCTTCLDPYRPTEQELCLAEFEGLWYRALTLDVDDDNFIVFFPDFGNMCELTSKSLRKIKEEFIDPPALAVNCTIIDPERLDSKPELFQKVLEILKNWMNTYPLKVEICKYEDETFYLRIPEIEAIFSAILFTNNQ